MTNPYIKMDKSYILLIGDGDPHKFISDYLSNLNHFDVVIAGTIEELRLNNRGIKYSYIIYVVSDIKMDEISIRYYINYAKNSCDKGYYCELFIFDEQMRSRCKYGRRMIKDEYRYYYIDRKFCNDLRDGTCHTNECGDDCLTKNILSNVMDIITRDPGNYEGRFTKEELDDIYISEYSDYLFGPIDNDGSTIWKLTNYLLNDNIVKLATYDDFAEVKVRMVSVFNSGENCDYSININYKGREITLLSSNIFRIAKVFYETGFSDKSIFSYFYNNILDDSGELLFSDYPYPWFEYDQSVDNYLLPIVGQKSVSMVCICALVEKESFWDELATDIERNYVNYSIFDKIVPLKKYWDLIFDDKARSMFRFVVEYGNKDFHRIFWWHINNPILARKIFTDLGYDYNIMLEAIRINYYDNNRYLNLPNKAKSRAFSIHSSHGVHLSMGHELKKIYGLD